MTQFRGTALFALLIIFCLSAFAGANLPGVTPEDAKKFMPVSQIQRGMKGYGLTVFQGTKIEKFDVEILGVMKQANTGKDLILVRVAGGPTTERHAGIIGGMSGSPCYINGKLIGAISYGANFAKEPVGMVTPIADMLEAWDSNLPKNPSGLSSVQTLDEPVAVDGLLVNRVSIDEAAEGDLADGVLQMRPLATPLMVRGFSSRGMEKLSTLLKPYHLRPMAAFTGRTAAEAKAELVPGAAVGMSLASGDIDITGIGTLTYRRGDKVVGFGHPMLGIGAIDAPMCTAYIEDVLVSYQSSNKIGAPIKTVGRIFQDRPFCIAGSVGSMPKTIPVTVWVDDTATKRKRKYEVQVVNHPLLASAITNMVIGEAIFETRPAPGDATATVNYEVVADEVGRITGSNIFFDQVAVDGAALGDVGTLLQILAANRFYPLDLKSVNVRVSITDKRNTANIDRIYVKKGEFEPGETVEIGVVLRPYKGERVTRTMKIKVPATAADGKVSLMVRGGASPAGMPMDLGEGLDGGEPMPVMPMGGSELANVDNIKQLIKKFQEREKNNQLVAQLLLRSTAVNVAGEKLTGLPSSVADIMKSSRNSGLKMERDYVKEVISDDMIVFGSARLTIDVKKKNLNDNKPKQPGMSGPDGGGVSEMDMEMDMEPMSVISGVGSGPVNLFSAAALQAGDESGNKEPGVEKPGDEPNGDEDSLDTIDEIDDIENTGDEKKTEVIEESPAQVGAPKPQGDSKPGAAAKVKPVARQAKTWTQRTQEDFAKGTFSGVSASSEHKLALVPTLRRAAELTEQFAWCLAAGKGGVYAGTGNAGKIYFISDDGDTKLFSETGELEVHSLVGDGKGNLYAGTSPNGRVFKITRDGKAEMIFDADERYVMAVAVDKDGNVYAGVGDAGKIYRITPGGTSSTFATVTDSQILSLGWTASDELIAGTGTNGVVYTFDGYGKATPVFDAVESSISCVIGDGKGNIFAGTSPKGVVYKISPDGRGKSVFAKTARVLSMARDKEDNIYAISDGTVVKIKPDETVIQLDSSKDKVQFLSLAFDDDTATLYAGTGNIGSIYISKCCDAVGTFESPVHDTKMMSRWGRVKWIADTPEGSKVEISTRTGNVETPDQTWSPWSPAYTTASGEQVVGNPARYIQYMVTLRAGSGGLSPEIASVTLSYLTPNQAPEVKLTEPRAGAVWSGTETIKWTGTDPDKDTITYDVYYSADGRDWKPLVGGSSSTESNGKALTEEQIVAKVTAELENNKDIPDEIKQRILTPQSGEKKPGDASGGAAIAPISRTTHTWDTKKVADGSYMIKVVASDKTSNPSGAMTDEIVSDRFTVCNSAPKLTLYKSGVEVKGVGAARIGGSAGSPLVEIAGVQYRVDGGPWMAADPEDGMYDSNYEVFTVLTSNLNIGKHKVEIQAIDAAGNAATGSVEVTVG